MQNAVSDRGYSRSSNSNNSSGGNNRGKNSGGKSSRMNKDFSMSRDDQSEHGLGSGSVDEWNNSMRSENNSRQGGVYVSKFSLGESETDVIMKNANLILNKLTLTKFDKLSDEFMNSGLDNKERLQRATELIVTKAQVP